jgi:hypothetical protein
MLTAVNVRYILAVQKRGDLFRAFFISRIAAILTSIVALFDPDQAQQVWHCPKKAV